MTKEFIYHLPLLKEEGTTISIDSNELHALGIVLHKSQECKWKVFVAYRRNLFVAGIVNIEWNEVGPK